MGLTEILYAFVISCIRIYKWIELQILKLFNPLVERVIRNKIKQAGLILHFPSDKIWTTEDEEMALDKMAKSGYGFESLVHIKIKDRWWIPKVVNQCTLSLGETYFEGGWDVDNFDDITEATFRFMLSNTWKLYLNPWNRFLNYLQFSLFNLQTQTRAPEVAEKHYDLGNDLYESFLDPWMQYTCGYWAKAGNLNDAQIHKMELIAKKLDLKPGMRVLDLGCGWGTLCKFLAEKYGVSCVGVNISKQGVLYGRKICEGLSVDIRLQDYREINEKFDRVVSIGLMEHVGFHNYREFFKVVTRCLTDDGIFLLHTIGLNHMSNIMPRAEGYTHRYIFPNGSLPFPGHIIKATEGLFIIEDWHNFGPDYTKTLKAWRNNFCSNWPTIAKKYDERFYRMWTFYLSSSAGVFQSRRAQLWQVVLTKDGIKREYRAAR